MTNRKDLIGNIGMYEVAVKLTRMGKDITVHGGKCAFDLSDNEGNRYEVKTATARIFNKDKEHSSFRGWIFASGDRNKNIARFEYTAYVLLDELQEVERVLLIPHLEDRFRNGRSATMKDTLWQKKHSNRKNLVGKKWYDFYEI